MSDYVTIANMALRGLGAKRITGPNDDAPTARDVKTYYDDARDAVLSAREWTFAMTRVELQPKSEKPPFGYSNAFTLPPDCIRVVEAFDGITISRNSSRQANTLLWEREGQDILCDSGGPLKVRYIRRVEEEQRFSAGFVMAFQARLQYELAIPITQSRAVQADKWALYEQQLADAATSDGLQGRSKVIRASKFTRIRAGNSAIAGPTV